MVSEQVGKVIKLLSEMKSYNRLYVSLAEENHADANKREQYAKSTFECKAINVNGPASTKITTNKKADRDTNGRHDIDLTLLVVTPCR